MRYLLILLLLISGAASAQFAPTSAKTKFINGLSIGSKDSTYFTNAGDTVVLYIGRDSAVYTRYKGFHRKLAFDGSLSSYKLIADSLFNNGYTTRSRTKQQIDSIASVVVSGYVPYSGATQNVDLGTRRLTARSLRMDSVIANGSGGAVFVTNSGNASFSYGAGGSSEVTFNGFAGYNANRASSYTARSFTDKNYVDSLAATKIGGSGTTTYIPKFTGSNTLGNSIMYESGGVTYVRGYLSVDPFAPVSPLSIIQVGQKTTLNSTDAKILVNNLYTDATALNGHAFADNSALRRTTGLWAYASYDGRVDIDGTGINADHYVSFQAAPNYSHTGTMKDNFGTYTTTIQSNGTLTNNYGHYVANPIRTGGTMTNNYGIYIENQTAGSNNYSIYSVNGGNYLGGFLQVNETISADKTGANVRFKGGGTGTTDAGIYVNGSGNAFFSDWDGTRGFVTLGDGNGYYFGGNFGVKTATPSTDFEVSGSANITQTLYSKKIIGNSSTPSISGGSATYIGTGASTSVSGNDMAGTATLTTGTGCGSTGASNEAAFTVTFASAYTTAPIVLIQAVQRGGLTSTDGPVNNLFFLRRSNAGTTGFTVYIPVGTTLTDSTTYDIFYHVIGK